MHVMVIEAMDAMSLIRGHIINSFSYLWFRILTFPTYMVIISVWIGRDRSDTLFNSESKKHLYDVCKFILSCFKSLFDLTPKLRLDQKRIRGNKV